MGEERPTRKHGRPSPGSVPDGKCLWRKILAPPFGFTGNFVFFFSFCPASGWRSISLSVSLGGGRIGGGEGRIFRILGSRRPFARQLQAEKGYSGCQHDHQSFRSSFSPGGSLERGRGRLVLLPGSLGRPAEQSDRPESGSPGRMRCFRAGSHVPHLSLDGDCPSRAPCSVRSCTLKTGTL